MVRAVQVKTLMMSVMTNLVRMEFMRFSIGGLRVRGHGEVEPHSARA